MTFHKKYAKYDFVTRPLNTLGKFGSDFITNRLCEKNITLMTKNCPNNKFIGYNTD